MINTRPVRAIVIVDEISGTVGNRIYTVYVPRWNEDKTIKLTENIFPEQIREKIQKGSFLTASINADTDRLEDLVFEDFELTPEEDLTNEWK